MNPTSAAMEESHLPHDMKSIAIVQRCLTKFAMLLDATRFEDLCRVQRQALSTALFTARALEHCEPCKQSQVHVEVVHSHLRFRTVEQDTVSGRKRQSLLEHDQLSRL